MRPIMPGFPEVTATAAAGCGIGAGGATVCTAATSDSTISTLSAAGV